LCYEFPPLGGGGARVVEGLSRELVRQGHEVDVVTMGWPGLPRREEVHGAQVYRVPCMRRAAHVCTGPEASTYVWAALPVALGLAPPGDLASYDFRDASDFASWFFLISQLSEGFRVAAGLL